MVWLHLSTLVHRIGPGSLRTALMPVSHSAVAVCSFLRRVLSSCVCERVSSRCLCAAQRAALRRCVGRGVWEGWHECVRACVSGVGDWCDCGHRHRHDATRRSSDAEHVHATQVGIEDCLHIEFEYNRSKYHLKDVVIGKIYFLLVPSAPL